MNNFLLADINNFSFYKKYTKPNLSLIDIDIDNIDSKQDFIKNIKHDDIKCSVYLMILNHEYEKLKKYSESSYIQTNLNRQTPLMLACKIGDIKAVKILLNEVGNISLNHKTAIDYAYENGDKEIINLLSQYENIYKN